jgi:thiol-disulfide isomerase/thioredoxin
LSKTCIVALILAAVPAAAAAAVDKDGWEVLSTPAKRFTLKDLAGRTLSSHELRGKIVIVDFWATWCGPCIRELPELQRWSEQLQSRPEIAFLSFNVTEEKPDVLAFVKEKNIRYPVYLADSLLGPYDVTAFPTKLVIDMRRGDGQVRFRRDGYTEVRSIEAKIQQLLDEGGSRGQR